MRRRLAMAVGVMALAALGVVAWRSYAYVDVAVSTLGSGATIAIARATDGEPQWQSVEPGSSAHLRKGPYLFKVAVAGTERSGLIAVDDDTPLVLK